MALFTAQYDTSRTDDTATGTNAMVTAGVIMTDAQRLRFAREWNDTLYAAELAFLHMRELPKHFAGREPQKRVLLSQLTNLLRRRVTKTFAVVLDRDDYRAINLEFMLEEVVHSDFALCAGSCVIMADRWAERAFPKQPKRHIHESGDYQMGTAQAFVRRFDIDLLSLDACGNARACAEAFQAADFLAWELRRGHEQLYSPPLHNLRPSLHHIAADLKIEVHSWTHESMRTKCEREGIQRRRQHPPD